MSNTDSFSRPKLITFTGADDSTDVEQMMSLSLDYPVEFGILFSPQRTGHGRYPSERWVSKLIEVVGDSGLLTLSAHICGAYSRELLGTSELAALEPILRSGAFNRVQINTADPSAFDKRETLFLWGLRRGLATILQSRDSQRFPPGSTVSWLFDQSGGRGTSPEGWPTAPEESYVGFAGGLKPENVAEAVRHIGTRQKHYWIDMESGVRDERDHFSISKCRQVCEAVFGSAEGGAA